MPGVKSWLGWGVRPDAALRAKAALLRGVFLFQELKGRDLLLVARALMEKSYAEGEIVFQEGDVGRALFVVAKGKVLLSRRNPAGGAEDTVAALGPGDFFGEMVLLDELPRSASARVGESAVLYILYKSQFDQLLERAPSAATKVLHALARLLSARLRRAAPPAETPRIPSQTL